MADPLGPVLLRRLRFRPNYDTETPLNQSRLTPEETEP